MKSNHAMASKLAKLAVVPFAIAGVGFWVGIYWPRLGAGIMWASWISGAAMMVWIWGLDIRGNTGAENMGGCNSYDFWHSRAAKSAVPRGMYSAAAGILQE